MRYSVCYARALRQLGQLYASVGRSVSHEAKTTTSSEPIPRRNSFSLGAVHGGKQVRDDRPLGGRYGS